MHALVAGAHVQWRSPPLVASSARRQYDGKLQVFWAGHADKERVMRGTVGDMGPRLAADPEHLMGLLFIGRFLEGRPYAAGVEKATEGHR